MGGWPTCSAARKSASWTSSTAPRFARSPPSSHPRVRCLVSCFLRSRPRPRPPHQAAESISLSSGTQAFFQALTPSRSSGRCSARGAMRCACGRRPNCTPKASRPTCGSTPTLCPQRTWCVARSSLMRAFGASLPSRRALWTHSTASSCRSRGRRSKTQATRRARARPRRRRSSPPREWTVTSYTTSRASRSKTRSTLAPSS